MQFFTHLNPGDGAIESMAEKGKCLPKWHETKAMPTVTTFGPWDPRKTPTVAFLRHTCFAP